MKCELCEKDEVYTFSPDLDIHGLGACEQHREVMRHAYELLMFMGEAEYQNFIKQFKSPKPKKRRKRYLCSFIIIDVLVYWVYAKVCSSVFSKRNFV